MNEDHPLILVISAGHGGGDPGESGEIDGVTYVEAELAEQLCEQIRAALEGDERIRCVVMPLDDQTTAPNRGRLLNRVAFARKELADFFLEIHFQTRDGRASGTESFFMNTGLTWERSRDFAAAVSTWVSAAVGLEDRGARLETRTRYGYLGVLHGHLDTTRAAFLEVCFLDNPGDLRKYVASDNRVAFAIVQAVRTIIEKHE